MEWIKINDKKPDDKVNVLFVNINEYNGITEVRSGSMNKYRWCCADAGEDEIFNVTHWMLLPELPSEQNTNATEPQLPLGGIVELLKEEREKTKEEIRKWLILEDFEGLAERL